MGRKAKINKDTQAESWCFRCKDGGLLRVCDFKNCLKAYHPACVGKDDDFLSSEAPWSCGWHFCFICQNRTKFQCYCCPNAVCRHCLCDSEFVVIKEVKGFCVNCATLAGLLEGVKNPNSVEEKVDFNAADTYECMFKSYWEVTKEKQNLNGEHVSFAIKLFSENRNYDKDFDWCGIDELGNVPSDCEDIDQDIYDLDSNQTKSKRNKRNPCRRRNIKPKRRDFVGWGSRALIDFLATIGEDTSQELSQLGVTSIILRYCNEHGLFHPEKKKKVICDSSLQSLFRRKSVNKNSIYNILTAHFANITQSEDGGDDEHNYELCRAGNDDANNEYNTGCNLKQRPKDVIMACKIQAAGVPERESPHREVVHKTGQSCFAPMISQNIMLVFLRRSLVEELLKKPETFDEKVRGSFVRVKSDPNDYLQRNSHQLLLVTDVKRSQANGCTETGVLLQVCNRHHDIAISKLSDDNFREEECEDLRKRIKDGLLRQLTVVELEEKAKALHEDIMKHWIPRELARLECLINQANEKGWRRELSEYMNRMSVLQTPAEQSRLLRKVPEVIINHAGELAHEDASTTAKTDHIATLVPTPTRQLLCESNLKTCGSLWQMNHEADCPADKDIFSRKPASGLVRTNFDCNNRNLRDRSIGDDSKVAKGKLQQSKESSPQDPHQHTENAQTRRDDTAIPARNEEFNQEKSRNCSKNSHEEIPVFRGSISPNRCQQSIAAPEGGNDTVTQGESKRSNCMAIRSHPESSTGGEEQSKVSISGEPLEQSAIAPGINDAVIQAADCVSNQESNPWSSFSHPKSSCRELPSEQSATVLSQPNNFQVENKAVDAEQHTSMKQRAKPELIILSDDENPDASIARSRKKLKTTDSSRWYYIGPHGAKGGPYSMSVLKEWSDTMSSDVKFKVWKENQSQEEAIYLADAIRQVYQGK